MGLENTAGQTYSFGSGEIVQIMNELVALLQGMGVDIRDRGQMKAGFEKLFTIEYHGMPDWAGQSFILAPNHVSDFDALILGLLCPDIKIISKNDWVENPKLMAFLGPNYDLVGIDRDSKVSQARALVELIKHLAAPGRATHALLFPQGTISDINRNSLERIQSGVFTLSAKSGAPVLPVYMEQPSFNCPTRVAFGAPMAVPEGKQDCRPRWREAVLALQDGLDPPARRPVLSEKHANNNKPGDPFF